MQEMPSAVAAVTVAAAFVAALALLWKPIGVLLRMIDRVREFLDDWQGEAARPGVRQRAGVMERLEKLESGMETVTRELHNNGGSSLRDRVDTIANAVVTNEPPAPKHERP